MAPRPKAVGCCQYTQLPHARLPPLCSGFARSWIQDGSSVVPPQRTVVPSVPRDRYSQLAMSKKKKNSKGPGPNPKDKAPRKAAPGHAAGTTQEGPVGPEPVSPPSSRKGKAHEPAAAPVGGGTTAEPAPPAAGPYRRSYRNVRLLGLVLAVLVVIAALLIIAAPGTVSGWTMARVGSGVPVALTSVSCPSSSFCAAVDGSGSAAMYTHGHWSTPTGIDYWGALDSVSCASNTFCVAVDYYGHSQYYNGHTWSSPQTADLSGALKAVSCPSAGFCVAVDNAGNAVYYTKGSWSTPVKVDPGNTLDAVACTSSSFCVATDSSGDAISFNGSTWSTPSDIDANTPITGISCTSSQFCVAVDQQR